LPVRYLRHKNKIEQKMYKKRIKDEENVGENTKINLK
jgi:hypothetical protein